ncbi:hypothetical protein ACFL35_13700 [Candidatus Riflebacteria bacterium]
MKVEKSIIKYPCRGCAKQIKSENQRYSIKITIIKIPPRQSIRKLSEEFSLEECLTLLNKFSVPAGSHWRRFTFFVCNVCRQEIVKYIENLKDTGKTKEPDFLLLFESIVGYEEIKLSEEDLEKDFKKELRKTLEKLQDKSSDEISQEIFVQKKFCIDSRAWKKLFQFLKTDFLTPKNSTKIQKLKEISIH